MTKLMSLAATLAAAVVSVSLAQTQNQQQSDQSTNKAQTASQVQRGQEQGSQNMDQEFVKAAAADNLFEIRLGEFIQQRVQDPQIKEFAQMLVQDHQQAQKQLQQAALFFADLRFGFFRQSAGAVEQPPVFGFGLNDG